LCMYFGVIYININIYTMHTRFPQPDIYFSAQAWKNLLEKNPTDNLPKSPKQKD